MMPTSSAEPAHEAGVSSTPLETESEPTKQPTPDANQSSLPAKPKDQQNDPALRGTEDSANGVDDAVPPKTGDTQPATTNGASKDGPNSHSHRLNGTSSGPADGDAESELSEPGSMNSPDLANEIVVHERADDAKAASSNDMDPNEDEDAAMLDADTTRGHNQSQNSIDADVDMNDDAYDRSGAGMDDSPMDAQPIPTSPYPKRKRTATDLGRSELPRSRSGVDTRMDAAAASAAGARGRANKTPRSSLAGGKGVVLGHWRDSPVPEEDRKHAVIGFIDIRDRLRTRIQGYNLQGEHVSDLWPLAAKTGASWVTFEGIYFLPHLVGLDQLQVKEYVRLRLDAQEDSDEAREAAEAKAVQDAIRTVRESALADTSGSFTPQPLIAYGADVPEVIKRRRISGGLNSAQSSSMPGDSPALNRSAVDPLHGTRPTRILLGVWSKSEADTRENRHAVYGILGNNDMFRVKLVRETHRGEFKDGNFPQGAGALWIAYEEVDFDSHLKNLTRAEIKEYCRVRQYQLDQGEKPGDRAANEVKAAYDAQARIGTGALPGARPPNVTPSRAPSRMDDSPTSLDQSGGNRSGLGGQELRSSRRVEAMAMAKNQQQQQQQQQQQRQPSQRHDQQRLKTPAQQPSTRNQSRLEQVNGRLSYDDAALQRTTELAQREIARAEATQGRADLHATHRERAAAAAAHAATAAAAAAAAASGSSNNFNTSRVHESDDVRRLNDVWARQESMRARAGGEDAKIYDGIKYERKNTGPFLGKLVSHGSIINIDGEDYVEYRVLTKPSFF